MPSLLIESTDSMIMDEVSKETLMLYYNKKCGGYTGILLIN